MAHSSVNMEPLNATKCNKNKIKCLLTASTGIRTRDCATIHLTVAIFEMVTGLFRRQHRVLIIKIIKITFIQNQLQAVPMSKVFQSQKEKPVRDSTGIPPGFHRDSNLGLRNNSFDSCHLRNGNGIIPSSSSSPNQNHQNHIYSKSAPGGTYV